MLGNTHFLKPSSCRVVAEMVCSEISTMMISPRISFSHDLNSQQADDPDVEAAQQYIKKGSDAAESDDFFFSTSPSKCLHEPCLADEIFSNGKILPKQIKKKNTRQRAVSPPKVVADVKKIRLKELLEFDLEEGEEERKPLAVNKSFWQFRRTSSLNCEAGGAKVLIKTIQFLSRSKSTGSVPNSKHNRISRSGSHRQNRFRQGASHHSDKSRFYYYGYGSSSSSSSSSSSLTSSRSKPPLGRNRSYGSGSVRISPVLNMPLPQNCFCIANAVSLFGFGSPLCLGKNKSKRTSKKKTVV